MRSKTLGLPPTELGKSGFRVSHVARCWSQSVTLGPRVYVALRSRSEPGGSLASVGSESDLISARRRLVSSIRFWLTASASDVPKLTPMVPRRTRIVTRPQRMVIFTLLNVFLICLPRGGGFLPPEGVAIVVGRTPAEAEVEMRF